MSLRSVLFLVVVTVGLLAYLAFYEKGRPGTYEHEARSKYLFPEDTFFVDGIEIGTEYGSFAFERLEDGGWNVVKPIKDPANLRKLEIVLSAVEFAKKHGVIQRERLDDYDKALERFGLAQEDFFLRVITERGSTHLVIGNETPRSGEYYGLLTSEKKKQIVVLKKELIETIQAPLDEWRSRRVMTFRRGDVSRVVLNYAGQVALSRKGDQWMVEKPVQTDVVEEKMNGFLGALNAPQIQGFMQGESGAGMEMPFLSLAVEGDGFSEFLLVGAQNEAYPELRYAKLESRKGAFLISDAFVKSLSQLFYEVREKRLFGEESRDEEFLKQMDGVGFILPNHEGEAFRCERRGREWVVRNGEVLWPMGGEGIDFLSQMFSWEAGSFHGVVSEQVGEYGLKSGRYEVRISVKGEKGSRSLVFGDAVDADVYVKTSELPFVMRVNQDLYKQLPEKGGDLAATHLFDLVGEVREFSWSTGGGKVRLFHDGEKGWLFHDGREIDVVAFSELSGVLNDEGFLKWEEGGMDDVEWVKGNEVILEGEYGRVEVEFSELSEEGERWVRMNGEFVGKLSNGGYELLTRIPVLNGRSDSRVAGEK